MAILPLRALDDTDRIVCATLQKGNPHWSPSPFGLIVDAPRSGRLCYPDQVASLVNFSARD